MQATPEQRVRARAKALGLRGLDPAAALTEAHRIEGVPFAPSPSPAPAPAPAPADPDEIEALHWKHACEMRRADASTRRASLLLLENKDLRACLAKLEAAYRALGGAEDLIGELRLLDPKRRNPARRSG